MDPWSQRKREVVGKLGDLDKSRAGGPDLHILGILDTINALSCMYSTSSCAGRTIVVESVPGTHSRGGVNWLYVNHEPSATLEDVLGALENRNVEKRGTEVWFKLEPAIIHVCVRTLEQAQRLVDVARATGFKVCLVEAKVSARSPKMYVVLLSSFLPKRSGMIATRIVCELVETHRIETILSRDGKVVVNDDYLGELCRMSNAKLHTVHERIEKLRLRLVHFEEEEEEESGGDAGT